MRQFFYKSGLIVVILTMVSVLFGLCGIAVVRQKNIYKPIPGMSSDYVILYPKSGQPSSCRYYSGILREISEYQVKGIKLQGGCAVDLGKSENNDIRLLRGRFFSAEEYASGTNVALVREDMLKLCRQENNQTWFHIHNADYLVVGVYSKGNINDRRSNKYLVNLYAEGIMDQAEGSYGFFDNGAESITAFHTVSENDKMIYNKAENETAKLNQNVQSSINGAIVMYLSVSIVVLLNIFSAIYIWLRGRRKEIVLRKLAGAETWQIFWWVVREFMIFVLGTFALGTAVIKIFLMFLGRWEFSASMIAIFGTEMEWMGILLALLTILIIGFLIISVVVGRYLRKEIIQLVRQE